jgi:hypothetical protein
MNYGVTGNSVYGDIVQGASQLMGIVNQGKRDVETAEFRRAEFDERKRTNEFNREIRSFEAGYQQPGGNLDKNNLKSIDLLQTLANDNNALDAGGDSFDINTLASFGQGMAPLWNSEGRADFSFTATPVKGGMTIEVDQTTYDILGQSSPRMAQYLTVAGAKKSSNADDEGGSKVVSRRDIVDMIGTSLGKINRSSSRGAQDYNNAMDRFRGSAATSYSAAKVELTNDRSDAFSQLSRTINSSKKDGQRNLETQIGDSDLTQDDKDFVRREFGSDYIALQNEYQDKYTDAKTIAELQASKTEYQKEKSILEARTNTAVGDYVSDQRIVRKTPDWISDGLFNYEAKQGFIDTKGAVEDRAEEAKNMVKSLRSAIRREAEDAFYDANGGRSDANTTAFTAQMNAAERDMLDASANGNVVEAESYAFIKLYSPLFFTQQQASGVPLFAEKKATAVKGLGAQTPAPVSLGGISPK